MHRDAEGGGEGHPDVVAMRGDPHRLGDDGDVGARRTKPGHRRAGEGVTQDDDAVGIAPPRVAGGIELPQVSQGGGTENRVGEGMSGDIPVGGRLHSAGLVDDHPTEDHKPFRSEAVGVEPPADPHGRRASATATSSGKVILRLIGSPGTNTTLPPFRSTRAASSVASSSSPR